MRLKKIKVSGFKSFVEPMTIPIKSELTGIVGPNGCGKSNVIDAVRWVLGESSAKQIRGGDSIADVIFNGSRDRQPLSQASVELFFDNTEGRLGGEYAKYNEISIRRVVNREAQSNYFLNGVRCRRKDIVNIFLGTGLGPRSYAIIEQGMISRLIDAKPEDLRLHLEEVAGISKYKERRRETSLKLKHTDENLSRVNDLTDELDKQLEKLKRQASAAERFKKLKEDERTSKTQLLALKWQYEKKQSDALTQAIQEATLENEAVVSRKRSAEKDLIQWREQQHQANDRYNEINATYYQLEAAIQQLEQHTQTQAQRQQELQQELAQIKADQQVASQHQANDEAHLIEQKAQLEQLLPDVIAQKISVQSSQEQLAESTQTQNALLKEWGTFHQQLSDNERNQSVESVRMESLSREQAQLQQQLQAAEQQLSELQFSELASQIDAKQAALEAQKETTEKLQNELSDLKKQRQTDQQILSEKQREHKTLMQNLKHQSLVLAKKEAAQWAILASSDPAELENWLQQQDLAQQPRLGAMLNVAPGWAHAVEVVLGRDLLALTMDTLAHMTALPPQGYLSLVKNDVLPVKDYQDDLLLSKIGSPIGPVVDWLAQVYVADTQQEAQLKLLNLPPHASVITRDGVWLSHDWIKMLVSPANKSGSIEQLEEIEASKSQIQTQERQLLSLEKDIADFEQSIATQGQALEAHHQLLNQARLDRQELELALKQMQGDLTRYQQEQRQLESRHAQCQQRLATLDNDLSQAEQIWRTASNAVSELAQQRDALQQKKDKAANHYAQCQADTATQTEKLQALQLSQHKLDTSIASFEQSLQRMQTYAEQLTQRQATLAQQLSDCERPEDIQAQLQEKLQLRLSSEEELSSARRTLTELETKLSDLETMRSSAEQQSQIIQAKLQQVQLEQQSALVRCSTFEEQLAEFELSMASVIEGLADDVSVDELEEHMAKLARRISLLGPINLAAIDEYQAESERRDYLQAQHDDLSEALATLQNAMKKIDSETRSLFRSTYEQVNQNFSRFFPKLFGGGQAQLTLTSDDLLETGIAIMAKPPGKRVANIQALSGGEKALTAVAMVLSMFQISPAPFCMLDEVDAPLDDANVHRFCEVIKEMSKDVQFIFITHNKITMSMAEQLAGVTMSEPGVSRMVAVDIAQAMEKMAS